MRVVTFNVCGCHGDWPRRRTVIQQGLSRLSPDLVAFQESVLTADYDQVLELLDGYRVVHQGHREADGTGCSIASRWPITAVHETDLPSTDRTLTTEFAGRSSSVEIEPSDQSPFVLVNHKPTWRPSHERERELQAAAMSEFITSMLAGRDLPVILVGDLDAEPEAASIRFWAGRQSLHGISVGYRDAWQHRHPDRPGYTFSNANAMKARRWGNDIDRRIDYIFVSCNDHGPRFAVEACELIFDQAIDGVWASDHFGLYADLTRIDHL